MHRVDYREERVRVILCDGQMQNDCPGEGDVTSHAHGPSSGNGLSNRRQLVS